MKFKQRRIIEHHQHIDVRWLWRGGWLYSEAISITLAQENAIQKIPIAWTPCNFGGRRPWFICSCGRRVALLYMVGECFQCRKCSGLIHASVNESKANRAHRKMLKIRKRLGYGINLMEPILFKPPRMHYKTFRRFLDEYEEAEKKYTLPMINWLLRHSR